jgi:formylglycine-generating enzyme required for sulfatase activity
MKEVLLNKDICGFDEVIDLIDRTSKEALVEVEKILERAENDIIFIYFSGHGKKDFENDLCLLFNDTEEDTLLATSLTFDFINKCRRYPSRKSVIIVLDCCYSGNAGIRDTDVMEALKKHSGSGTIILTSTGLTGSPTAKEEEKLGHGVFTHYLIEGLERGHADKKGEGRISIDELYDYAFEKTTESCSQSPKKEGSIEGPIFIGNNPLKIKENEYASMKINLFDKYRKYKLPHSILNESQTVLRKYYEAQSTLEPIDETIYGLLNSFLEGDLSPENYIEAIQHLKGISVSSGGPHKKENVNISNPTNSKYETIDIPEDLKKHEIPKNFMSSSTGMEFVLIPAGEFMMGSPSGEENRNDDEGPVHKVTIKNSFYMGKYPVTQKQWEKVMENNPSTFKGESLPVESVSWDKIQEFLKKINVMEGTDKYRLPSEAEWEYACRAGTTTRYYFGDDESKLNEYAWYYRNSGDITHPAGQKKPNSWGLYDMHGNVWEWIRDRQHDKYEGAPSDGSVWEDGNSSARVVRGGSWNSDARRCRSAFRFRNDPGNRSFYFGFRLLRKL